MISRTQVESGASEMAEWVRLLITLSSDLHMYALESTHVHIDTAIIKLGVVVTQTCNSSTWEVENRRQAQGGSRPFSATQ